MKSAINISQIEAYLHSIICNVVSDNTFVGELPDTIQSSWKDMCLIDCGNMITDYHAYGSGTVLIWLYANPMSDGRKNVAKMNELETKLNEVIENGSTNTYRISRRDTYTDYDRDRKWHVNIVELIIKIY